MDLNVGIFRIIFWHRSTWVRSETNSAPPSLWPRPCALDLRHYVALLIAAVLQGRQAGRQSSCRDQGTLTTTERLMLGKSETEHLPIL